MVKTGRQCRKYITCSCPYKEDKMMKKFSETQSWAWGFLVVDNSYSIVWQIASDQQKICNLASTQTLNSKRKQLAYKDGVLFGLELQNLRFAFYSLARLKKNPQGRAFCVQREQSRLFYSSIRFQELNLAKNQMSLDFHHSRAGSAPKKCNIHTQLHAY